MGDHFNLLDLSVVIVNYNVKFFLEQCLSSLKKSMNQLQCEVFVVDNNSVDGSVATIKNKFPWAKLIVNEENVGFSKANNQAIRRSTGKYVLLLNPDTLIKKDTLQKCFDFMEKSEQTGALGVRMIDGKGQFLPESKRGLPTPEVAIYKMLGLNKIFPSSKIFGKYHLGFLAEDEISEVEVLAGAYMFLRKSALEKTGLLDEDFFMYGEDIDLSYRMLLNGYKNVYFPDTTIIHYKGESTKKQSAKYIQIFYGAMLIFTKKHYQNGNKKILSYFLKAAINIRAWIAHILRFGKKYGLLLLESSVIFTLLLYIKNYWEEHIKLDQMYPQELVQINFPVYTFIWMVSLVLSGSYADTFSIKNLFRGLSVGTLIILAFYGLMPEQFRFSRGIILAGSLSIGAAILGIRSLLHYRKFKHLNFGQKRSTRTLIIGNKSEYQRIKQMASMHGERYQILGFASPENPLPEKAIGSTKKIREIVDFFEIEEIIFSSQTIDSEFIIQTMMNLETGIYYKIVPENSSFMIGSNNRNQPGEFLGNEIELKLNNESAQSKKRLVDLLIALGLLLFAPVLFWFAKNKKDYFNNAMIVMIGKKTWIGYCNPSEQNNLPSIKEGIFTNCPKTNENISLTKTMDQNYAKFYNPWIDFNLILKKF